MSKILLVLFSDSNLKRTLPLLSLQDGSNTLVFLLSLRRLTTLLRRRATV